MYVNSARMTVFVIVGLITLFVIYNFFIQNSGSTRASTDTVAVTTTASDTEIGFNEDVLVSVRLDAVGGTDRVIDGVELTLKYPEEMLEYRGYTTNAEYFESEIRVATAAGTVTHMLGTIKSGTALKNNATVIYEFSAKSKAGTATVELDPASVVVGVQRGSTSPIVYSMPSGGRTAQIMIKDNTSTSPTIVPPTSGPTTPVSPTTGQQDCSLQPKGDANCDGVIDATDYVIWRKKYLNETIDPKFNPDFDKNGSVNLIDLEIWRTSQFK